MQCEEVHHPEINVPKAMIITQVTAIGMGIIFVVSTLFIMPDLDMVAVAVSGQAGCMIFSILKFVGLACLLHCKSDLILQNAMGMHSFDCLEGCEKADMVYLGTPGSAFALLFLSLTCGFGLCVECLVAASRFVWAFARDGGLPFSG